MERWYVRVLWVSLRERAATVHCEQREVLAKGVPKENPLKFFMYEGFTWLHIFRADLFSVKEGFALGIRHVCLNAAF
jgi:hypothetical protein